MSRRARLRTMPLQSSALVKGYVRHYFSMTSMQGAQHVRPRCPIGSAFNRSARHCTTPASCAQANSNALVWSACNKYLAGWSHTGAATTKHVASRHAVGCSRTRGFTFPVRRARVSLARSFGLLHLLSSLGFGEFLEYCYLDVVFQFSPNWNKHGEHLYADLFDDNRLFLLPFTLLFQTVPNPPADGRALSSPLISLSQTLLSRLHFKLLFQTLSSFDSSSRASQTPSPTF